MMQLFFYPEDKSGFYHLFKKTPKQQTKFIFQTFCKGQSVHSEDYIQQEQPVSQNLRQVAPYEHTFNLLLLFKGGKGCSA